MVSLRYQIKPNPWLVCKYFNILYIYIHLFGRHVEIHQSKKFGYFGIVTPIHFPSFQPHQSRCYVVFETKVEVILFPLTFEIFFINHMGISGDGYPEKSKTNLSAIDP